MNQAKPQNKSIKDRQINPKKLLLSKWTAVQIIDKQKHFLVTRLIMAEPQILEGELNLERADQLITDVEIEAIYSSNKKIISWKELQDASLWKQGWC